MATEPFNGSVPDHAPEAVQDVALVDDHVKVALPPLATVLGLALRLTVGVCFGLTVTVVDWTALPPDPVQAKV